MTVLMTTVGDQRTGSILAGTVRAGRLTRNPNLALDAVVDGRLLGVMNRECAGRADGARQP